MKRSRRTWLAVVVVLLVGCSGGWGDGDGQREPHVTITELFTSEDSPADNLDSLASWAAGPWVLATAKATDQVVGLDARGGRILDRIGERGEGPRQFRCPNGIATGNCAGSEVGGLFAVHDDRAVVAFSCSALLRALGLEKS